MFGYSTKIVSVFIFLLVTFAKAQFYELYQPVAVEQYKGKNFLLEAKIWYTNSMTNSSWTVLAVRNVDANSKVIKQPFYNDDAGEYYKKNEWSHYELKGKIDSNTKFLTIGFAFAGNDNYFIDDLKLYVLDGKNKIEIPLKNGDFENEDLKEWKNFQKDDHVKVATSSDKFYSGKQSLYIDNSNVKTKPTLGNNAEIGKYAEVNGVKLYYEIYGNGTPVLLLHGNNSSMGAFRNQFDPLTKGFQVIALDSRGQGKSSGDETPLTYELMAKDVNVFLDQLGLKKVDVLGWSDGGNIAVILARDYPDKVNKMAIMGTVLYNDDSSVTKETNVLLKEQVKTMKERGVAENNMDYRLKMLLINEPHIDPNSLEKIKSPSLIMAGEHDVVKEKHTKLIAEKIPNSKLLIFKGGDHEAPEKIPGIFNKAVVDFFTS
jgi:pimeloyl-ACP methyl ester carboxylesterase